MDTRLPRGARRVARLAERGAARQRADQRTSALGGCSAHRERGGGLEGRPPTTNPPAPGRTPCTLAVGTEWWLNENDERREVGGGAATRRWRWRRSSCEVRVGARPVAALGLQPRSAAPHRHGGGERAKQSLPAVLARWRGESTKPIHHPRTTGPPGAMVRSGPGLSRRRDTNDKDQRQK